MNRPNLSNSNFYGIQQALDKLRSALATLGKVKVTALDTVANYLGLKLVGSANVSLTVLNPGGNEQLRVDQTGLTVPNLAGLAALDPTPYHAGIECYVGTLKQAFVYEPAGTLPANGITVVAAVGGGIWTRRTDPVEDWIRQTSWFIDGQAGNDEADGLVLARPIQTWAEFVRRVGMSPNNVVTIIVVDDLIDDIVWKPIPTATCEIFGLEKEDFAGVVGTYTRNPATQNYGSMTTVPAWVPGNLLNSFGWYTNGGTFTVVADRADLGANTAGVSTPLLGTVYSAPVPGQTVSVYHCPTVPNMDIPLSSDSYPLLYVSNLHVLGDMALDNAVYAFGCRCGGVFSAKNATVVLSCIADTGIIVGDRTAVYGGSYTSFVVDGVVLLTGGCPIVGADGITLRPGSLLVVGAGGTTEASQMCCLGPVFLDTDSVAYLTGLLFGVGPGANAVTLRAGSGFYIGTVLPTLTVGGNNTVDLNGVVAQFATQVPIWDHHTNCGVASNSTTTQPKGGASDPIRVGLVGNATSGVGVTTRYLQPNYTEAAAPTVFVKVCNQNGILQNLRVDTSANVTGTYTVTVLVNTVPQLTATILNGTATISDTTTKFVLVVGDRITVLTELSDSGVASNPQVSFEVA